MIHVYDIGNTDYSGMGDAIIQPLSGKVKQVAGGRYDLSMECAMDPDGKWKHLVPGAIVKASVPEEVIENAYVGLDVDVYKTNTEAALRESASEPEVISYPTWPNTTAGENPGVGMKTSYENKNYICNYWDPSSRGAGYPPSQVNWWSEIARYTQGSAALVTLPTGAELYFVEDYNTSWYKMSTFYGLVGYIKKSYVTYDRHLTPSETQPRVITEQLFRITEPAINNESQRVSVNGIHVSYDLAGILIQDVSIGQASPAMAIGLMMQAMMIPYDGVIATNLTTAANGTYTGKISGKNAIYALLDPDAGIVSTFHAKFTRDNWDVFLMQRETVDRGFRILYGKNARGINWQKNSANLVNRVVPVAKDEKGNDLYLPEMWIDSPLISQYPVIRMERLAVKGQVGKDKGAGDGSTWTETDLLNEMRAKASERFSVDHADAVTHEVTVQVEMLGDTAEYAWMRGLENVLLYDTVTASDEEIGLEAQLLVTELEWDIVRKKISGLKLSNVNDLAKRTVTGYNVQNNSISGEKLMDGVAREIVQQAVDIIPQFAEPFSSENHMNTKDQDGLVTKGSGNADKVWKTDGQGNPGWREDVGIPASEKGQPNGVATLDNAGKVPESQMPSYVDDIIEGYLYNGQFYKNSAHTQLITPEIGKIYVDLTTSDNLEYRWSGSVYSQISKTSVNDSDPTLAWGTRSKVGDVAGVSLHVTMPGNPASASDGDPTLAWGTRSKVGTANGVDLHVTMPGNPASASDGDPTLAWGTRSKVGTANGVDLHVTMPGNPDTWRPVQDNLNSSSATDSLSAKQGKVLNDNTNLLRFDTDGTFSTLAAVKADILAVAATMESTEVRAYGFYANATGMSPFVNGNNYYGSLCVAFKNANQLHITVALSSHKGGQLIVMGYHDGDWYISGKLSYSDVVDNLTSTTTDLPLSANQGKVINDKITSIASKAGNNNWWEAPADGLPHYYQYEGQDTTTYKLPSPYCMIMVVKQSGARGVAWAIKWALLSPREMWFAQLHDDTFQSNFGEWEELALNSDLNSKITAPNYSRRQTLISTADTSAVVNVTAPGDGWIVYELMTGPAGLNMIYNVGIAGSGTSDMAITLKTNVLPATSDADMHYLIIGDMVPVKNGDKIRFIKATNGSVRKAYYVPN